MTSFVTIFYILITQNGNVAVLKLPWEKQKTVFVFQITKA